MSRRRRAITATLLLAVAWTLVACDSESGSESGSAGGTTTPSPTRESDGATTTSPTAPRPRDTPDSSTTDGTARLPQRGQPLADGRHAAFVTAVDPEASTVTIDVVQFLIGRDADEAYRADTGDTDGAPNDYYIRNNTTDVRTLRVRASSVTTAFDDDGSPAQRDISLDELPLYLDSRGYRAGSYALFWIVVSDNGIVGMTEQYRP
ncbi:MAG TPA: hypothetical protein VM345_18530 [Acidimicrobiales bacterium]|jgi:hypothetical protein|nr:hypothetical protein [Acidimicrobiales bacterium]